MSYADSGSSSTLVNARRELRNALHARVRGVENWAQPSLAVFRNHLLDDVGSDARPLTNLLLEALDRGVLDTLPRERMAPAQWTARCTSLVMQWVAERFVQPEAARWAVEAWAYALGTIEQSQLTTFVDPSEQSDEAARVHASVQGSVHASVSGSVHASVPQARATPVRPTQASRAGTAANAGAWRVPSSGSGPASYAVSANGRPVAYARPVQVPIRSSLPPRKKSSFWPEPLDNIVGRTSLVSLAAVLLFVGVQIARGPDSALARPLLSTVPDSAARLLSGAPDTAARALTDGSSNLSGTAIVETRDINTGVANAEAGSGAPLDSAFVRDIVFSQNSSISATDGIGLGGAPTRVLLAPGNGAAPSLAMTRLPAEGATPSAYRELTERSNVRALRGETNDLTSPTVSSNAPGVPGITRNAMPLNDADIARARRIAPATRPTPRVSGSAAPAGATNRPAARAAPGLDVLQLESGRRIQGRVEVIRASSVVFRDAETGLRYEFLKNDIDEIITEFGNAVRFRQRGGAAPGTVADRRSRSLAGRYIVRYEAARVNGSAACADLWRGPSGSDVAIVRHRAGDDTLSVSFEGGDTFPSVLDADGFFNSTFRIMPGQAELATALTTRLSGYISPDQSLSLQVNVIGYRRVQGTTGVSCHIIVDATGERSPG